MSKLSFVLDIVFIGSVDSPVLSLYTFKYNAVAP